MHLALIAADVAADVDSKIHFFCHVLSPNDENEVVRPMGTLCVGSHDENNVHGDDDHDGDEDAGDDGDDEMMVMTMMMRRMLLVLLWLLMYKRMLRSGG